jgi:hypothetical protein
MLAQADSNGAVAAPKSQAESLDKIARDLNLGGRPPRPSWLTTEIFQTVCDRLVQGDTLRKIAKDMGFHEASFRLVVANDVRLATHVLECRILQTDAWGDEIVEISDDKSGDTKTVTRNGTEYETTDYENINRSKLRVDTRKWLMGKINPKRYGDKLETSTIITLEAGDSITNLLMQVRADREPLKQAEAIELPGVEKTGPASGF